MENKIDKTPALSKERIEEINNFEKQYKTLYFQREDFRVLYDAIWAFKSELYFASLSTMRVFIEKYLRDLLIDSKIQNTEKNSREYREEYTEIETIIEDWENLNNEPRWDSFRKICKELKEIGLLGKDDEMEKIYEINRVAIQHWIYWRLYRRILWQRKEEEIGNLNKINDASHRKRIIADIMAKACYVVFKGVIIPLLEKNESLKNLSK